jgi:hypothetical protein
MTETFPSNTVNTLEAIDFIAGSWQELSFSVYDDTGAPLSLNGKTCTWELARYGQSDAILTISASTSGSSNVMTTVLSDETNDLSGKFLQQPIVYDPIASKEYRKQGIVIIWPRFS